MSLGISKDSTREEEGAVTRQKYMLVGWSTQSEGVGKSISNLTMWVSQCIQNNLKIITLRFKLEPKDKAVSFFLYKDCFGFKGQRPSIYMNISVYLIGGYKLVKQLERKFGNKNSVYFSAVYAIYIPFNILVIQKVKWQCCCNISQLSERFPKGGQKCAGIQTQPAKAECRVVVLQFCI